MCLSGAHYSIDDYEDRIIEMAGKIGLLSKLLNINMV